jgi:acetyltransferase-like isoleucine patch superfamily enzyme
VTMFIHPSAIVETRQIGEGTRICAYTHVMGGVSIGIDCNIGDHCFVESGASIGNQVTIKNGNMIWEGVHLEDGVFVGPQVVFSNDLYPRSPHLPQVKRRYADRAWLKSTVIKQGASVGAGAVILAGVTIGEFCLVGAGSIVTRNLPRHALAVGRPARVRGWVCRCGQPLVFVNGAARCGRCDLQFTKAGVVVELLQPAVRRSTQRPSVIPDSSFSLVS